MKTLIIILITAPIIAFTTIKVSQKVQTPTYYIQHAGDFQDRVQLVVPKNLNKRDSMINLYFKSNDLVYKIKVFPRLLDYLSSNPSEYYTFNWRRYETSPKVATNAITEVVRKEVHCWESISDGNGKVLIFAGDERQSAGQEQQECLVDVEIKELADSVSFTE